MLHCVHFKDMDPALLREIPALLSNCLNGPAIGIQIGFQQPIEVNVPIGPFEGGKNLVPVKPKHWWNL